MKTKHLLPHQYKAVGWILIVVCIPLGLWKLFSGESFPFSWLISLPWPFSKPSGLLDPPIIGGKILLDILDEVLSIGSIAGLIFAGFSKQEIEDERIALLRLEALQWGVYANYFVLILCIIFIHGSTFFLVTVYNVFTLLLIFVCRFNWLLLIKPALEMKREKALI